MNKKENIFDYKNLDDCPNKLKKQLKKKIGAPYGKLSMAILNVLEIRSPLSVDEIILGIYRNSNIVAKTRAVVINRLHELQKMGFIKRLKTEDKWNKLK